MPPRSMWMKRRIFGFQRRVWWPKWTPASSSSRIVTTATVKLPSFGYGLRRRGSGGTGLAEEPSVARPRPAPPPGLSAGSVAEAAAWYPSGQASALHASGRVTTAAHRSRVARPLERVGEFRWERRIDLDTLARDRMREGEPRGVEELTLEAEVTANAVHRVARDRQADRPEVDADLVRSSGLEVDGEERVRRKQLAQLEVRHGVAGRVGVERLARAVATVAADRRLDPSPPRTRPAPHQRQVLALDLAPTEQRLKAALHGIRACDDEQARRVAVEPVDDARPVGVVAAGRAADQAVDERARPAAGSGMHDDPGRLVDHEQVVVLVRNAEVGGLRLEPGRRRRGSLELDLLPTLEPMALRARLAVDGDAAVQRTFRRRARPDLGKRCEKAVEPRPCGLCGNADLQDELRRAASRSAANNAASRTTTPTTMNESARLKAGQNPMSRKSVTAPSRTRSSRFEMLPPRTSPSPTGRTGWRAPERAKKSSIQPTTRPVSAITAAVAVGNRPKAIPEFSTRWIEKTPRTSTWSPSATRLVTSCFVS